MPPPINPCIKGLEEFTETATEIEDSNFIFCPDTCFIDCEELYSSAIPYDYIEPCFNPKNPEQLAYYRFDNTAFEVGSEIWVADFCTGEKKMLVNNALYGLDWSVKDWLIYTADDQKIWKVKSNGDSLTQLTFVGDYNRYPKWSPDGERIAFNAEIQGGQYFFIMNSIGEIEDTVDALSNARVWTWVDSSRICYVIDENLIQKFRVFNLLNGTNDFLNGLSLIEHPYSYILSMENVPGESSIFWCAIESIGRININDKTFVVTKKALRQERYLDMSIRLSKDEILINKRIMHNLPSCRVDSEVDFYLIAKEGTNTRKISLPQ